MIAISFDALTFSHQLTDAGMPREQADKFAEIQKKAFEEQNQHIEEKLDKTISAHLATKEDIWNVKHELKKDISNLDKKIDTKSMELDQKIDLLHKEFEGKFNLLYWMLGFILAFCASNAAIIFKLYFQ